MKKLFYSLLACMGLGISAIAGPGDTTIITSHNNQMLDYYNNFDSSATFPSGSVKYRKIYMEFTLGKYQCPTGSQYCGDWDYTVDVTLLSATNGEVLLGRLITPYANASMPRTPWTWQHPYVFDITDYYPLLQGNQTIRIHYSGYSGGFTGTVKFYFVEGTPPRNVVGIDNLWYGSFPYGNTSDPITNHINTTTKTFPANAVYGEMKNIITGHGGDNTENCSEFCSKWYQFQVNGTTVEQKNIWRDNCGSNFLYPQSGTWVFNRGNWCPGDLVHEIIHKLPSTVAPGSSYSVNLNFQSYTSGNQNAQYAVGTSMFYYGNYNYATDAGIENIIAPNNKEEHYRYNPMCGTPIVTVKNNGSNTITSIKLEYGVVGQTLSTYTYAANLSPLATADVSLPALADLNNLTGTNKFIVRILEVNGAADQDIYNNQLQSTFTATPVWPEKIAVIFKMSGDIQGYTNQASWTIEDMNGNVIKQTDGTTTNSIYRDTVQFPHSGCYKLTMNSSYIGWGLRFFSYIPTPGYIRAYNAGTGVKLAIPATDLGSTSLEGNFGNGFTHYFTVSNVTGISNVEGNFNIYAYPNPANDHINVDIANNSGHNTDIQLVNLVGQSVYNTSTRQSSVLIPVAGIPAGIYTLICTSENGGKRIEKVTITH